LVAIVNLIPIQLVQIQASGNVETPSALWSLLSFVQQRALGCNRSLLSFVQQRALGCNRNLLSFVQQREHEGATRAG
jgi:hypothetical protein